MNELVQIHGRDVTVARLDNAAYYMLMEANALPNQGRTELIEGVLVEMSPSNNPHGNVLSKLNAKLLSMTPPTTTSSIDVAINFEEGLVLAPDMIFYSNAFAAKEIPVHAIELIVEISVTSLRHDLEIKSSLFSSHVIPHYWVIDVDGRKSHVHANPSPDGYQDILACDWDQSLTPPFAPERSINLSEILGT